MVFWKAGIIRVHYNIVDRTQKVLDPKGTKMFNTMCTVQILRHTIPYIKSDLLKEKLMIGSAFTSTGVD